LGRIRWSTPRRFKDDRWIDELQALINKHQIGGAAPSLVGGQWGLAVLPDYDKVYAAVQDDYKKNPEGFYKRTLEGLAGFLCQDQEYSAVWRTAVVSAALDVEEG